MFSIGQWAFYKGRGKTSESGSKLAPSLAHERQKKKFLIGPLCMSLVTGLAQLPGRILLSVDMANFNPVDRDENVRSKTKIVPVVKLHRS